MSNTDMQSTPAAALTDMAAAERRYEIAGSSRKTFLVLLLVQLAASGFYAGLYIELVRTGPINAVRLTAVAIGLLSLCIGAIFVYLARPRGKWLFLASGLLLLYSVPLWGWAYMWAWAIGLGVALSALGYSIIRRLETFQNGSGGNAV